MKKICKCCGRNRKIGKFGQLSNSSDGKNPYCRDCMRDFTNSYKNSPKGKKIQEVCVRKWKTKNKKAIKDYNREYYIKNKARILYNKRAREETECVLIIENPEKPIQRKINKGREICTIIIDPKPIDKRK